MSNFNKIEEAVDSFLLALKLLGCDFQSTSETKKFGLTTRLRVVSEDKMVIDIENSFLFLNGAQEIIDLTVYFRQYQMMLILVDKSDIIKKLPGFDAEMLSCKFRFNSIDECVGFILKDLLELLTDD